MAKDPIGPTAAARYQLRPRRHPQPRSSFIPCLLGRATIEVVIPGQRTRETILARSDGRQTRRLAQRPRRDGATTGLTRRDIEGTEIMWMPHYSERPLNHPLWSATTMSTNQWSPLQGDPPTTLRTLRSFSRAMNDHPIRLARQARADLINPTIRPLTLL